MAASNTLFAPSHSPAAQSPAPAAAAAAASFHAFMQRPSPARRAHSGACLLFIIPHMPHTGQGCNRTAKSKLLCCCTGCAHVQPGTPPVHIACKRAPVLNTGALCIFVRCAFTRRFWGSASARGRACCLSGLPLPFHRCRFFRRTRRWPYTPCHCRALHCQLPPSPQRCAMRSLHR